MSNSFANQMRAQLDIGMTLVVVADYRVCCSYWADLDLDITSKNCLSWAADSVNARLPLERIALSALDMLRSDRHRLKRCEANDSCGWLFYDETKSNQRRWCSMDVCGTIEKMRRYRAKQ